MRRVLRASVLAVSSVAGVLVSSGCLVSSLHPVYDADSIVFDEALIGAWEHRETEVRVDVARGEWRSYDISYTDRFGTSRYTGHLTTIAAARFLNILPEEGLEKPPFVVATNGFMQVEAAGATLRVREPDYAAVLSRVRIGKLGLASAVDVKQNVLITAPSATMRKWLAAAVKDARLWTEWKVLTRTVQ